MHFYILNLRARAESDQHLKRLTSVSGKGRVTSISGKGTKYNIMETLKEIDNKILGPDGKKDEGIHQDDKELLNGFLEGYNDAEKEEYYQKMYKMVVKNLLIFSLVLILSYYLIQMIFPCFAYHSTE